VAHLGQESGLGLVRLVGAARPVAGLAQLGEGDGELLLQRLGRLARGEGALLQAVATARPSPMAA